MADNRLVLCSVAQTKEAKSPTALVTPPTPGSVASAAIAGLSLQSTPPIDSNKPISNGVALARPPPQSQPMQSTPTITTTIPTVSVSLGSAAVAPNAQPATSVTVSGQPPVRPTHASKLSGPPAAAVGLRLNVSSPFQIAPIKTNETPTTTPRSNLPTPYVLSCSFAVRSSLTRSL